MQIANTTGLPECLFEAVKIVSSRYDKGECDYSLTELIAPPRPRALKRFYSDRIVVEAEDLLYSVIGSSVHALLEALNERPGYKPEVRWFGEIGGKVISGQADVYDERNHIIKDYKFTSSKTYQDGVKDEWVAQLNGLNYLSPTQSNKLVSIGVFRDYSKLKPVPAKGWGEYEVEPWPIEKTEEFLLERIRVHEAAAEDIPECTEEERWSTPDQWAVMKKGNVRASKLADSEEEAADYISKRKDKKQLYVEKRHGTCMRCQHYCEAASVCSQWQNDPRNPNNQEQ